MMARLAPWLLLVVMAAGCRSPEASRVRGGGPGADPNNRPEVVELHRGSDQYWRTPVKIGAEHPPLEPARQAQRMAEQ